MWEVQGSTFHVPESVMILALVYSLPKNKCRVDEFIIYVRNIELFVSILLEWFFGYSLLRIYYQNGLLSSLNKKFS